MKKKSDCLDCKDFKNCICHDCVWLYIKYEKSDTECRYQECIKLFRSENYQQECETYKKIDWIAELKYGKKLKESLKYIKDLYV